jgi:Predicted secreted (periplasmic) protein
MIRNLNIILIFTSVLMLAGVYALKFSIENTASERTELVALIDSQEGELSLVKADEAVLSQPGHIEPIVRRHQLALAIEPVKQEQFGAFDALPMRPVKPNTAAMDSLFESLEAGIDPIDAILELEGIE